jgi:hypothetical protein
MPAFQSGHIHEPIAFIPLSEKDMASPNIGFPKATIRNILIVLFLYIPDNNDCCFVDFRSRFVQAIVETIKTKHGR